MTAAHEEEWALDRQDENTADPNANEANAANEAPEPSELEQHAMDMGWKPETEWKGDKSGWTPADQYIRATFKKQQEGVQKIRETSRFARAAQRDADDARHRLERLERTTNEIMSIQEQRHRAELEQHFEDAKYKAAKEGNDEL